jgi:hypothetical protein
MITIIIGLVIAVVIQLEILAIVIQRREEKRKFKGLEKMVMLLVEQGIKDLLKKFTENNDKKK